MNLISSNTKLALFFYLILLLVSNLLELLGLSSILIFINFILDIDNSLILNYFENNRIFSNFTFDKKNINYYILLIVIIFITKNIISSFSTFFKEKISVTVQNELAHITFKNLMSKSLAFHEKNSVYKLFQAVMSESRKSGMFFLNILQIINDLVVIITVSLFVYLVNKDLFLLSITLLSTSAVLYYLITKKDINLKSKLLLQLRYKVVRIVFDTFSLAREILTNNLFSNQETIFLNRLKKYQKAQVTIQTIRKLPRNFYEIIILIGLFIAVISLSNFGYDKKYILSFLSILVISLIRILPSITSFSSSVTELSENKISYDAINNRLKLNVFIKQNFYKFNKIRDLSLKGLSFKYKNNFILRNLNLNLRNFKSLGITGASGSGKSTLVKLICNYLDNNRGEIIYNKKIKKKNSFHYNFFYLDSKPFLMNGTIKDNILFFSKFDKKKFDKVISIAQIKKNIINRAAKVEDNDQLSQGQKQRIVLARALYKNPSLVILDEVLSNIDDKNVNKINANLKKYGIPFIIVSHNQKHLKTCEKVFMLSKGNLIVQK